MTSPFEVKLASLVLYGRDSGNEHRFTSMEIGRRAYELSCQLLPSLPILDRHTRMTVVALSSGRPGHDDPF